MPAVKNISINGGDMKSFKDNFSIIENLYDNNKKYLASTAIIYYERKITYDELFRNISNVAQNFKNNGINKGDMVMVMPVNTPEFVYTYYALNMIGAIVVPIHPLSSLKEIKNYLEETNYKMIVCADANCKVLDNAMKETNKNIKTVIAPIGNSIPLGFKLKNIKNKELIKSTNGLKANVRDVMGSSKAFILWDNFNKNNKNMNMDFSGGYKDTAVIVHTGGTTGVPKGVKLSNENGIALVENHINGNINLNRNQTILGNISMYTAFGFFDNINVPLSIGVTVVLEPIYSPKTFVNDINKYSPNILFTVPSFMEEFIEKEIKEEQESGIRKDFSNIDIIIIGGQKMSKNSLELTNEYIKSHQPMKYIKTKVDTGYGSSETCAALTCTIFDDCNKLKVGKPFPYVNLKIVDLDTKKELETGKKGEVLASGPTIMQGYYNMDDETNKVLEKDDKGITWYNTGDVGYLNETGELEVVGRIRKMITMFNGYKIASPAIEDMVETLNEVNSCVVIPMKDPNHPKGEVPKAYVSLNNNFNKREIYDKVIDVVNNNMNERNKIYDVVIVDEIPVTKMGKKDFKMIEILDLFNSIYPNSNIKLNKSQDLNYDYVCMIDESVFDNINDVINTLKSELLEKEVSNGIDINNIKTINYKIIKHQEYIDDNENVLSSQKLVKTKNV